MHFGQIPFGQVVGIGNLRQQRRIACAVQKDKIVARQADAAFLPALPGLDHQMHRHRVQHFIANRHAGKRYRKVIQPHHFRKVAQGFLLARTQFAGEFDDRVATNVHARLAQFGQDVARKLAGSGTEFEEMRIRLRHQISSDMRDRRTKKRRYFRGSCKIPVFTEFCRAAAVITKAGRIQGQFHVPGKRDPAGTAMDFIGDQIVKRA